MAKLRQIHFHLCKSFTVISLDGISGNEIKVPTRISIAMIDDPGLEALVFFHVDGFYDLRLLISDRRKRYS